MFEFATAARILFGPGAAREVAPAATAWGGRALLVSGVREELASGLVSGLACVSFPVSGEPTVALVRQGLARARAEGCSVVIAVGGGSAIDTGKAVAGLLGNGGDPLDYLEVIGKGQSLRRPAAPFIAVPTTAGTGAEVTRNAVLASPEHGFKASLRSPVLLPRLAVVDPELTLELPPAITAATGMDALTQVIEPFVSPRASPLTDPYAEEGIRRAARSLARAFTHGADLDARTDMSLASLFGGLCLANAGLGAVHGFAAPVGGMFPAPHGAVCAALLAPVMEVNIRALRARAPGHAALSRYQRIAGILTGHPGAAPEDGAAWVAQLCARLSIPPLGAYGLLPAHVEALTAKAAAASSMKANPIALTAAELSEALTRAL